MPRQARLDAPGTFHYEMMQGIEGLQIFREDQDREDFISHICQLVEESEPKYSPGLGEERKVSVAQVIKKSAMKER